MLKWVAVIVFVLLIAGCQGHIVRIEQGSVGGSSGGFLLDEDTLETSGGSVIYIVFPPMWIAQ